MIDKLRKKVFWSIELTAFCLLLAILLAFNYVNWHNNALTQDKMLSVCLNGMVETQGVWSADSSGTKSGPGPDHDADDDYGDEGAHHGGKYLQYMLSDDLAMAVVSRSGKLTSRTGFLADTSKSKAASIVKSVLATGDRSGREDGCNYRYKKSGGKTYVVLYRTPLIDEDTGRDLLLSLGALILAAAAFALIARCISRRIVAPVRTSIETQKRFIADASHELKTPVTIINANAEILHDEIGDNKWLTYIREESSRMTALIASILQLSRLDYEQETKSPLNLIWFDPSEILMETALPLESVAFERGITLAIDLPDGAEGGAADAAFDASAAYSDDAADARCAGAADARPGWDASAAGVGASAVSDGPVEFGGAADAAGSAVLMVKGDPEILRQITEILLENALKHTPDGGKVTLTAERVHPGHPGGGAAHSVRPTGRAAAHSSKTSHSDHQVAIRVTNTGDPIPEDVLPHIFDRFYKADESRKYESGSFGLGLAIAKSLAARTDAEIGVESGEGETTFEVVFTQAPSAH